MKRNDCDDFPDTVIIGSSALYPLAKGAIQMLILLFIYYCYRHIVVYYCKFCLLHRAIEFVGIVHTCSLWLNK